MIFDIQGLLVCGLGGGLFRRSTYYYNIESLSTSIHSVLVVSAKRGVWDLDVHGLFVGFLSCTGSTDLTLEIPSTCYVQHVLLWIVVSWLGLHRSSYRNTYLPNSSTSTVVGPNGCSRQSWWMIQHCASGLLVVFVRSYWLDSVVGAGGDTGVGVDHACQRTGTCWVLKAGD
jgi:hypothetical protein